MEIDSELDQDDSDISLCIVFLVVLLPWPMTLYAIFEFQIVEQVVST